MRRATWDKNLVAFACLVDNITFKREKGSSCNYPVECHVVNIITKISNYSKLFKPMIVGTWDNTIKGTGAYSAFSQFHNSTQAMM